MQLRTEIVLGLNFNVVPHERNFIEIGLIVTEMRGEGRHKQSNHLNHVRFLQRTYCTLQLRNILTCKFYFKSVEIYIFIIKWQKEQTESIHIFLSGWIISVLSTHARTYTRVSAKLILALAKQASSTAKFQCLDSVITYSYKADWGSGLLFRQATSGWSKQRFSPKPTTHISYSSFTSPSRHLD